MDIFLRQQNVFDFLILAARKVQDKQKEKKDHLNQCFSTGGPRSFLCGPPNFSHFVLNCNFLHNYYNFYEKPTLLALNASRNDKISQFYLHIMHERDRKS